MRKKVLLLCVAVCFVLTCLGAKSALACGTCGCWSSCSASGEKKIAPAPGVKTGCSICNVYKKHRKSGNCPTCRKRYRKGRKVR